MNMQNKTRRSRNLLKIGLMVLGSAFANFAESQTVTTSLATGTGNTTQLPIYGLYGYTYSQSIYLASDINPVVQGQPSLITKIRYYYVSGNLANSTSWTLYMGNTTQGNFGSTTNWIPLTGLTQVFSGNIVAPAGDSWLEITLDTPFPYDGTSNLVVGVDENTAGYSSITWRNHTTGANRSMYYYSDSNNPDPNSPPTASGRFGSVPQTQFEHTPASTCGATLTHTTTLASDDDVCVGDVVNFSIDDLDYLDGLTYQWQYNTTGTWIDFAGETDLTLSTEISETMNVRVVVTCAAATSQDISEEASVIANANPVVTVDVDEVAFCSGSNVVITATGAATYAWSPSTGLSANNTASVTANPTNTTMYTVTGTNAAGCTATATSSIYPLSKARPEMTVNPTEICEPNSLVTLTISTNPSNLAGGADWEYRFLGPDGTTVAQDWNVNPVYTFIPTEDSVYAFFYQIRSNNCADELDSVLVSIPVGFGANVDVENYNCTNLGGVVTLSQIFGQREENIVYENSFSDPTNNAGLTFTGQGQLVNGKLQLTASQTSANGSATITLPSFVPAPNNSMTVEFKISTDLPINTFGTGGADGLAYSFADAFNNTGSLHNGNGNKLRLAFDAAANSPNQPGIYLTYGYGTAGNIDPGAATTLAFSPNTAWKNQLDVPVVFNINPDGIASLTVGGTTIFQNIQMPQAFKDADVSNWKHYFSAQTGGDALRHQVADFKLSTGALQYAVAQEGVSPANWQFSPVFEGLLPGTYDVWLTKNPDGTCQKMIETIEITNTNPVVALGGTIITCEGETVTLDAGNPSATYIWSNSNVVTQTLDVTETGTYSVQVLDTNNCVGLGSATVIFEEAPSATSIFVQGLYPTITASLAQVANASEITWEMGDGTTYTNAPATISHTYEEDGTFTVTATLSNDCGEVEVIKTVTLINTASLNEMVLEGVSMYPNPANNQVKISYPAMENGTIQVYSISGQLIESVSANGMETSLSVLNWEKGIYLVKVSSNDRAISLKLSVN